MYADVLIQYGISSLDHTFTYHIPDNFKDIIDVGMKVTVPFGKQKINGFVISIHENIKNDEYEIKDIINVITKELKLNKELMELGLYIKEKTLCTLISAYQTMLPTSLKISNSKESHALTKSYISLNKDMKEIDDYISNNKRSLKQIEILNNLREGRILKNEITSKSSLKTLLDLSLVKEEKEEIYRINKDNTNLSKHELTEEQQKVKDAITSSWEEKVILLHGVTGSGKTEIYMDLCDDVIANNKSVIILVPEISLTTQIVNRFYNRFGSDVAIFHSSLSEGEKYDEYKKIMRGEVHIVVGTRSAIFTQVKNLGLIIIDEEHSSNYKQDNNPRYHALDIALWRIKYNNCPLVLGSATPSYESMARALKGVYTYLPLKNRIGKAKLPKITLVDMKDEYRKHNMILSDTLKLKIMETLNRGEQVMLLLNRRGYSTFITCQSCGFKYKCPHCDISLTYHKTSNHLRCHYCGYTKIMNEVCPECHEKTIRDFGLGTEKIEKLIKELYPSYKVKRMDADTTSKKGEHEKIITAFENHEYDILIGTQMISKGLDFKKVTLVGIINADESLNIPDFRSGENTFSLLSQVSGRAGRSELPGEVIIQTFNPDNKTLNYVLNNDYIGNYKYEMEIRKTLRYPPYYYLVSIKVISKNYDLASHEAVRVSDYLRNHLSPSSIVLGPTTALMFKMNNQFRFQIIIKYRFDDMLNNTLLDIKEQFNNKDISLEIDTSPIRI